MSNLGKIGFKYTIKSKRYERWMKEYGAYPDSILELVHLGSHICNQYVTPDGGSIWLSDFSVQWYDEQSAMREITPVREAEEPVPEWCLPVGTFFRVNGKHTPLYLVMSNSHVFNLTEKQMHTTCSSRFKNVQLLVANVQLSEVL